MVYIVLGQIVGRKEDGTIQVHGSKIYGVFTTEELAKERETNLRALVPKKGQQFFIIPTALDVKKCIVVG